MDGVGNTGLTAKSGRLEALRSCGLDALMVGVRVLRGSFGYGNWWGDAAQPRRFEHAFCGLGTWLCMFGEGSIVVLGVGSVGVEVVRCLILMSQAGKLQRFPTIL